jgi:hypothetical protein
MPLYHLTNKETAESLARALKAWLHRRAPPCRTLPWRKSGIGLTPLKRFEKTGALTLRTLVALRRTLGLRVSMNSNIRRPSATALWNGRRCACRSRLGNASVSRRWRRKLFTACPACWPPRCRTDSATHSSTSTWRAMASKPMTSRLQRLVYRAAYDGRPSSNRRLPKYARPPWPCRAGLKARCPRSGAGLAALCLQYGRRQLRRAHQECRVPVRHWHIAPAYDTCFSHNPAWTRQHQMLVGGKAWDVTAQSLIDLAELFDVRRPADRRRSCGLAAIRAPRRGARKSSASKVTTSMGRTT